jgi:hypothetical protein
MTWALIGKLTDNWPDDYKPSTDEVMRWLKLKEQTLSSSPGKRTPENTQSSQRPLASAP